MHKQARLPEWLIAIAVMFGSLGCAQQTTVVPGDAGGSAAVGGSTSTTSGPEACVAAGGKCIIGPGLGCFNIGPQDCNPTRNPGGAVCCLGGPKVCEQDGGVAMLKSADYDRSCKVDSDCVAVPEGDVCYPCLLFCPSGVVNHDAEASYRSDLAKLTDPLDPTVQCNCQAQFTPCCIAGTCHSDSVCGLQR